MTNKSNNASQIISTPQGGGALHDTGGRMAQLGGKNVAIIFFATEPMVLRQRVFSTTETKFSKENYDEQRT